MVANQIERVGVWVRALLPWRWWEAIALRVFFTMLAAVLLKVPVVQLVGGVLLVWIAYRLMLPEDDPHVKVVDADASLWQAIQTIVSAMTAKKVVRVWTTSAICSARARKIKANGA